MPKLLFIGVAASILWPTVVVAGPLYGTIRFENGPASGVSLVVECPPSGGSRGIRVQAQTDARGSFSMRVPARGRCSMHVESGNRRGSPFAVFVSDNPIRFDAVVNSALARVR